MRVVELFDLFKSLKLKLFYFIYVLYHETSDYESARLGVGGTAASAPPLLASIFLASPFLLVVIQPNVPCKLCILLPSKKNLHILWAGQSTQLNYISQSTGIPG